MLNSPFSWLAALAAALLPFAANAGPTVYQLRPESALLRGCFDPCACPVLISEDLRGAFELERVAPQPIGLYDVYAVSNVSLLAKLGGELVHITGSGVYRVGGEFAVLQQLTLDLSFGDQPPQRFDSGLQPGGGQFPRIDVDVSMNGQYCFDTVLQLHAEPAPPGDGDGDGVPDASDVCPHAFDPDQADADKNGIGDACECGDQNGDGSVSIADLLAINAAIFGRIPPSPLCDTNYDGRCNVQDIVGANLKIYGKPAYCRAYPPPGP
jgi:hypothetical protein